MTTIREKKKILLVCKGNTCRSPMAKVILEQKLKEQGQLDRFEIDSAAFHGMSAVRAVKNAREAIKEIYGQDLLANHWAKYVSADLIEQADLILTMTGAIRDECSQGKTWTLNEYAGNFGDIADPYGGNLETYLKCAQEISKSIDGVIEKLLAS